MSSSASQQATDWIGQAAQTIRAARSAGQSVSIEGHGSKAFYGQPALETAHRLDTTGYSGVVDYDPTELVMVARCGTPIAEVERVLAQSQQMLAFEPPRFNGRGTVGGMVATGLSGPRRAAAGAMKDFVLGMTVLDDQGTPLRFGGTVMKNVAGYDMARLHTGALGTLGLIVDVSIKVLPTPPAEDTLAFEVDAPRALEWVNAWAGQPLPITATSWHCADGVGRLHVRLSGAVAAVRSAKEKLGGVVLSSEEARGFWQALRDQSAAFFHLDPDQPQTHVWRLSLPSTTPDLPLAQAPQWIEWSGALRWVKTDQPAEHVRAMARERGGHATLYRSVRPDARAAHGAFAPVSPALMKVHQRLKHELDAQGVFNPGRLFAGL